ncbi:hypothetical protein [Psychrobacter immobilis]|uniref:hypothetical protein n=1 Tax=Psychrobacter immobilis TaxID=498 RepID=UPI001918B4BB|nr:hypothetical protein [Psychrobacter immobilis]
MQSIGDGEHLINTGSLLSQSRPSLFATDYLPLTICHSLRASNREQLSKHGQRLIRMGH